MPFSSLGLAPPLVRALADQGYETPTPIQAKAIPPALEGRDVLGCAQTGTGKTAAFALPILHGMHGHRPQRTGRGTPPTRALILSPTREAATQIGDSFKTYGKHTKLRHTVIFGGVGQRPQEQALRRGIDVIVATPGRLIDLMEQGLVNFRGIEYLVLDEADRMLDMGFIKPIKRIIAALPEKRQTMLFSATMPSEIRHLAESVLVDPVRVAVAHAVSTAALIEQSVYMVARKSKTPLLRSLLDNAAMERALVFTRTKYGADRVCRHLRKMGVTADAIHGNKSQNQRQRALDGFRAGKCRVLVATDVAARGLDVDGITHVVNYDLPYEPEAYVHRIGRTGRAGATGIAISFCDEEQHALLRGVEKLIDKHVPVAILPSHPDIQPARPAAPSRDPQPQRSRQSRRGPSAPAPVNRGKRVSGPRKMRGGGRR